MTAYQRDTQVINLEKARAVEAAAQILHYDLEGRELARHLVRNRARPVQVGDDLNVYIGGGRCEMATRAYQGSPLDFTLAAEAAGCAIRWQ